MDSKHFLKNAFLISTLLMLLFSSSCTIQKRRYSSGFNIEFLKPWFKTTQQTNIKHLKKQKSEPLKDVVKKATNDEPVIEASINSEYNIKPNPLPVSNITQPNKPAIRENTKATKQYKNKNNIPPKKTNPPKKNKRKIAIITGASLLLMALVAGLAVPALSGLFIRGNIALTGSNVAANFSKYIGSVIGWVTIFLLDIIISWGIYKYYKKERPKLATGTSLLRLVYTAILGLGILQLLLITPLSSATNTYNSINLFNKLWGIGLIVFGLHLITLGILFKNKGEKKWVTTTIKTMLILAGIGYMVQYIGILLVTNPASFAAIVEPIFLLPMILGEVSFAFWKIIKGGKTTN